MGSHNWDGPGDPASADRSWPEGEATQENRPRRRGPFPPRIMPKFGGAPPTGSPVVAPPPVSGAGTHPHGHSHTAGVPRGFIVLAALIAIILLGICAAGVLLDEGADGPVAADGPAGRVEGGGGGLIGRENLDQVAAAGELLRERPYQVSFEFRRATSLIRTDEPTPVPVATLTWRGELRSTGGTEPSWDARTQVTAYGADGAELGVVDSLTVVDTGGVRYLNSASHSASQAPAGRPWTAATGADRGTYCWPAGTFRRADGGVTAIPLPVADPVEYLDVESASVTTEPLPENATRYLLAEGLTAGDRLAAAIHALATATGVDLPEYSLAVTVAADATLAAVELTGTGTADGTTLSMIVHSPGTDVVITPPPAGQISG
ncbi:hypothetical protein J2S43_005792 [Catenuloplanes nepalensis]|uniref:GerMN domain-containing protein n=1 Tax=Catenuloplanes nepalensis TaxID=587533 RepID=A0ABT9N103_9ACTN|nr:hypothetical protein [Catenuloplanes nepalensis]MDP9797280.1 hypothetical protein [Catenuloplanes nepalensis]